MIIFFYLSQLVDMPQLHKGAWLDMITRKQDITGPDWDTATVRSLFHVRPSEEQPDPAFLDSLYRCGWLNLADNDFALLLVLLLKHFFHLQFATGMLKVPKLPVHLINDIATTFYIFVA